MKKYLFLLLITISLQARAQQVPDFSLVNVMNGSPFTLQTFPACAGLVVIFTSNTCPYDEYYRARIAKLSAAYGDRVPFVLVNSGIEPADAEDAMVRKGKQLNLSIPYLSDKNQTLMKALDAKKSSEVFLLKNTNGKFQVVYRGGIDDNPQVEADVRQQFLKDAIEQLIAGKKIEVPDNRAVGCNVRRL